MLRFLSRRKVRNTSAADGGGGGGTSSSQIKSQRITANKNKIDCRVILLDNTDLSIELSVSRRVSGLVLWGCSRVSKGLYDEKYLGQVIAVHVSPSIRGEANKLGWLHVCEVGFQFERLHWGWVNAAQICNSCLSIVSRRWNRGHFTFCRARLSHIPSSDGSGIPPQLLNYSNDLQ